MTTSSVEITGGVEWTVEVTEESGDVTTVSLGYAGPQGPQGDKGDKGDPGDSGTGGAVDSVVAGDGISVDATDPTNPVITNTGASAAQGALADTAVQPEDLGTAASHAATDFDAAGAAAAAQTAAEAYTDETVAGITPSSSWDDITDKPATFPPTIGTTSTTALAGDTAIPDSPDDIGAATSAQGVLADSAVQPGDLAVVATSGAYTDLSGTPTLGTAAAADTGDFDAAGAAAAAQTAAEGYADTGLATKVPATRTVNGKALSADVTLAASDVSAVPTTRTVNGHALSGDVTVTAADVATISINAQTGTTYTVVSGDKGKLVTLANASAITLTVPASVFSAGDVVYIQQRGSGQVTIAQGSGMTLDSSPGLKIAAQSGSAAIVFLSASTATVIGRLSA